jgi:trimethylamine--corrinoid protein Co-methyltransferase
MSLKGLSGGLYRPLSFEDIEAIHRAALSILERTGLKYETGLEATIDMLQGRGITVDRQRSRIFFKPDLVMSQTDLAPEQVILYSRDGQNDLDLTRHRVYLGTGGAAVKILDLENGQVRATTLSDLYQLGRLVDALDNIHFYLRPCIPTDIPVEAYDVNSFFACLKATAKHVMAGVGNEEGLHKVLGLASMIAGGLSCALNRP